MKVLDRFCLGLRTCLCRFLYASALFYLSNGLSHADETSSIEAFDRLWSKVTLWQSEDGLGYAALSGRLQADSYWYSADEDDVPPGADDHAEDFVWRRFRFGGKGKFHSGVTWGLEADLNLNNEIDDWYTRLTDAYLGYSFSKALNLRVLKQSVAFTLDGAISSKNLLTPERNNVTNNLWDSDEYYSGVQLSGSFLEDWSYKAGVFSGEDDDEIEFSQVGYFTLTSIGYNFAKDLDMKNATVRIDYVYNSKNDDKPNDLNNNRTTNHRHTVTLASLWAWGDVGLNAGATLGTGMSNLAEQSELRGFSVTPYYSLDRHNQFVARYTFIESEDENGIRLNRYESELVSGRGDEYNEFFVGYNLYIYGQKLKLQAGVQYTDMSDSANDGGEYSGWGLTTAFRNYW
ncbi:MAG: porin [Pseudomonadota bacterium]